MRKKACKPKTEYCVGDIVVERNVPGKRKRYGEITTVIEDKKPKLQIVELRQRDLTPFFKGNEQRLRLFTTQATKVRKYKPVKFKKKNDLLLGDVLRHQRNGRIRFGLIVGFRHPDGLYSESWEKGYNGKDLIECVEISGKSGLARKLDSTGNVVRFEVGPKQVKRCEILPMDKNGGFRIKDYWEFAGSAT